jgi:hypothetical protein
VYISALIIMEELHSVLGSRDCQPSTRWLSPVVEEIPRIDHDTLYFCFINEFVVVSSINPVLGDGGLGVASITAYVASVYPCRVPYRWLTLASNGLTCLLSG